VIADQGVNYVDRFIIDEGHTTPRVVTISDALWVEISDGGCPRPVGGLCKYRWHQLWTVGVVAGSSVGATPRSDKLLRD
jgi:hypothetical protein